MAPVAYDLAKHVLLTLRGERALAFLEDVSAQEVAGLVPGRGALAAFLDPKGRVLADALVLAGEGGVLVLGEEATAPGLERAVTRVAALAGVEVATEVVHAARILGEGWDSDLPSEEHAWKRNGDLILVRVCWGADGYDVVASEAGSIREFLARLGAAEGDADGLEAARIAAGRPRYGLDVTADTLVNETPLLERAVAESKGCYPGQESVARVRNLGRVRKRLVVLDVSGSPPAPGTPVTAGGTEAGHVTSAAGAVALAVIRSEVEAGDTLRAGDATVTVRVPG